MGCSKASVRKARFGFDIKVAIFELIGLVKVVPRFEGLLVRLVQVLGGTSPHMHIVYAVLYIHSHSYTHVLVSNMFLNCFLNSEEYCYRTKIDH